MKFSRYIIGSAPGAADEIWNIRDKVLTKLQELVGSNTYYPQPGEWLKWALNPTRKREDAVLLAVLSIFYLELDSLAEQVDRWEDDALTVHLVTYNDFISYQNEVGDNFEIYNKSYCTYGRHAVNLDEFNPGDIFYVCLPAIDSVIKYAKTLASVT
jgi:hypothetical protein